MLDENGNEVADNTLDDDLFSAAFDEAVGEKPEVKEEVKEEIPEVKEEVREEIPEVKEEVKEEKPEVDIEAIINRAVAATKPVVKEESHEEVGAAQTPEEVVAEEQFKKDWPEHAAREDRLKKELDGLKNLLVTTVSELKGQINPLTESINLSAEEKHYNTIFKAHPDAEILYPKVEEWIKSQPKFLQPQYEKVLESGTANDVVDLYSLFKKETKVEEVVDPKIAEEARKKAENDERLKRMKTPASVRTSVTAEDDPNDFDGAFEAAVKKFK